MVVPDPNTSPHRNTYRRQKTGLTHESSVDDGVVPRTRTPLGRVVRRHRNRARRLSSDTLRFVLRYIREETQETRLAVEIQKIRNANHSRETKPYEITMDGISVYQQANIF